MSRPAFANSETQVITGNGFIADRDARLSGIGVGWLDEFAQPLAGGALEHVQVFRSA
jgi:hypothetical protein